MSNHAPCQKSKKWGLARLGALLLLTAITCQVPFSARAQAINPFRSYRGPTLPKADVDEGRAAAARLLGSEPKPVGTTETWTGPASGNSGTLTIERDYRKQGHECRAVRSRVAYKQGTKRNFLFQVCRVGSRWRLAD